jgi:predicted RNA-binding Zn ribbon-like protein
VSQPGARAPAPGRLALVQSFLNSHYDLETETEAGADLLATPRALTDWLARRGLIDGGGASLSSEDHQRALAAREALRELARANNHAAPPDLDAAPPGGQAPPPDVRAAVAALNQAARGAAAELRFGATGPPLVVAAELASRLDRALGVVLAVTASAMLAGNWERLKVCPGEHCGWAFYDHSRNRSGRWCSMAVCGGRAKARAYYVRRHRGGE